MKRVILWMMSLFFVSTLHGKSPKNSNDMFSVGAHASFLGRKNNVTGTFLGMEYLYGFNLFSKITLSSEISLQPLVGYYQNYEGSDTVGVKQRLFVLGGDLLYGLYKQRTLLVEVGIANRLDMISSTIRAPGTSATNPIGFFYRMGPSFSVHADIASDFFLSLLVDFTWTINKEMRSHLGSNLGFGINL